MRTANVSTLIQLGGAIALSSMTMLAQAQSVLRVDFAMQQVSGPAMDPALAETGYMLLTFDDSAPLLTDGVTTTFAPTYSAELHLDGAHASDTPPEQTGSLYQLGDLYGLSLELTNSWSEAGVSHTDGFLFTFDATTGATPLLDSPIAFAQFAAQQAASSFKGHIYLSQDISSEMGSSHQDYEFTAAIASVSVVPEPSSLQLWGLSGLLAAGLWTSRKRSASLKPARSGRA